MLQKLDYLDRTVAIYSHNYSSWKIKIQRLHYNQPSSLSHYLSLALSPSCFASSRLFDRADFCRLPLSLIHNKYNNSFFFHPFSVYNRVYLAYRIAILTPMHTPPSLQTSSSRSRDKMYTDVFVDFSFVLITTKHSLDTLRTHSPLGIDAKHLQEKSSKLNSPTIISRFLVVTDWFHEIVRVLTSRHWSVPVNSTKLYSYVTRFSGTLSIAGFVSALRKKNMFFFSNLIFLIRASDSFVEFLRISLTRFSTLRS